MSLCSNQTHPIAKECPPSSDKGMLPPTTKGKARRREGDAAGEGKRFRRSRCRFVFHRKRRRPRMAYGACYLKGEENTLFRPRWYDCRALSSFRPLAYWDSSLRALPALSNKEFRLGPVKRWQQQKGRGPCSCCARPLSSRFGIYYKRENPLQITTPLLGSVWNGREQTFLDI